MGRNRIWNMAERVNVLFPKVFMCAILSVAFSLNAAEPVIYTDKTAGYFDDPANWDGDIYSDNSNRMMRVQLSNKTVPYVIAVTNRHEYVGSLNLLLAGSVENLVLDVSQGVLKQIDGDGSWTICVGDPFSIWSNSYAPGPIYLSASSNKRNNLIWSNTVFSASRTVDADSVSSFDIRFEDGYVSFAEPGGNNSVSIFQTGNDGKDDIRDICFRNVRSKLPIVKIRGGNKCGLFDIDGGECDIYGDLNLFFDTRTESGIGKFRVSGGAEVNLHRVSGGDKSFIVGYAGSAHRTNIIEITGADTRFSTAGSTYVRLRGDVRFNITEGAQVELSKAPTPYRYVYFGDGAGSAAHVAIDGEGSLLDATGVGSFNVLNASTITVSNGGTFVLPRSSLSLGSDDADDNDVVLNVQNEGSCVICPPGSTLSVGDRIKNSSRATLNVKGGYLGPESSADKYLFYVGQSEGAEGVVNLSGGEIRCGCDNNLWIGVSGSGELNVSGGSLFVDQYLIVGGHASASPETSVFRQSGGYVRAGSGLQVCMNHNAGAENNRKCTVELEGGVLETSNIFSGGSAIGGKAVLSADGGTVKATENRLDVQYPFIGNFDSVAVGEKGLVIDTAGWDEVLAQSMTNIAGKSGLLVKTGAGRLVYGCGSYHVSNTELRQGSLSFLETEPDFNTSLKLASGTKLSLSGACSRLCLDALELDGAEIELDAGDMIEVAGNVALRNLSLIFSSVESGSSHGFLVCKGRLDEESLFALGQAYCSAGHADGYHGAVSVQYDEATEKTTVRYVSVQNGDKLAGDGVTTYVGSDGVWNAEGNWSNAVPDGTKKADFSDGAAAKTVTVPQGATVAALSFGADGVKLSGDTLSVDGIEGTAEIEVASGSAEISAPLRLSAAKVAVDVAGGSSLALTGAVSGGGIVKTGGGALSLAGANGFIYDICLAEGWLSLAGERALGGVKRLGVAGGTLEVLQSVDMPAVTIGENSGSAQIFKVEADTSIKGGTIEGTFVKRGAGRLTIDLTGATSTFNLSTAGKAGGSNGEPLKFGTSQKFPADGSVPEQGITGFTVAEGEVVLKDDPANRMTHNINGSVIVGMHTSEGSAQPALTIDGADIRNLNVGHLWVGRYAGDNTSFVLNPTLRIINGGKLTVDTPRFGGGKQWTPKQHNVTVALTNGTLNGAYTCHWSNYDSPDSPIKILAKDSFIFGASEAIHLIGPVEADLDNTYVGKNATAPGTFHIQSWSTEVIAGTILLRNGSVLNINKWANTKMLKKPLTVAFDNAHYRWGGGDFDLAMGEGTDPGYFRLEMRGAGMIVEPAAGATLDINWPLTGEGGFVNAGEGTVSFASGTYQFGGVCEVRSGTVDLTEAGVLAAVKVKGGGTVKGLSANAVRIMASADDDWNVGPLPVLEDCSLGRVTVDFGRSGESLSNELPKGVVLGKVQAGTDVSRWRLANTGYAKVSGRFSVSDDGTVSVDFERVGLAVIVR